MTRRRDVLVGLLGAPLASQLFGCDAAPTADENAPIEGEMRGPNVELGHQLRDPLPLSSWDEVVEERVEVAVVGGGPAGLAAAWRLRRQGRSGVRVYEMEDVAGGTSRGSQSRISAHPWGAHYLPVPRRDDRILRALLDEMGALEDGQPAEHVLVREPDERVFYQGFWYRGLYPYAGASEEDLAQLARFQERMVAYARMRDAAGKRAFTLPMRECSSDPSLLALDTMSAAAFLDQEGFRSPRLRWLCDYACRDDYGLRLEVTSAWALVFYWAARIADGEEDTADVLTWPEGNAALTRHMASALRGRVDANVMAVDVRPHEDGSGDIRIALLTPTGAKRKVRARHVVMATPRFISERIVHDLPLPDLGAAGAHLSYGPWMVANLHLEDRPRGRGAGLCWDNVLYDSPSLGYVNATHQRGREVGPTVWTYYYPFAGEDVREERTRLFEADLEEWQALIAYDLGRAHPDLRTHLRRIDIWRWGHGMTQPRVGFLGRGARFGAGTIREPNARIHYAHSDLSGLALFEEAFHHGVRAADEIIAARHV